MPTIAISPPRIVPLLNARWPHFAEAVARSASLCGERERLLDEMLAAELATLATEDGALAIEPLTAMSAPRRPRYCAVGWLDSMRHSSREVPGDIWREVAMAREDAFPCLRLGQFYRPSLPAAAAFGEISPRPERDGTGVA